MGHLEGLLTCSEHQGIIYVVSEIQLTYLVNLETQQHFRNFLFSCLPAIGGSADCTLRPGVPRAGARTSQICHYEEEAALSTAHP